MPFTNYTSSGSWVRAAITVSTPRSQQNGLRPDPVNPLNPCGAPREISTDLYKLAPEAALEMICECGLPECHLPFAITLADYERIRQTPEWFAVLPGHELPEVEHVVERRPTFVVVEKDGVAGTIARETDPRA